MRIMKPSAAIRALQEAGWTELSIAREVGATQPTINRVKHGAEPSYSIGAALVRLGEKVSHETVHTRSGGAKSVHPDVFGPAPAAKREVA